MSGAQGSMKSSDTSRSNKTFLFSLLHERLLGHPTPRILLLNTGHKPTGNPLKMDGRKSPHCVSKHYWLASTCSRVFYRDYESLRQFQISHGVLAVQFCFCLTTFSLLLTMQWFSNIGSNVWLPNLQQKLSGSSDLIAGTCMSSTTSPGRRFLVFVLICLCCSLFRTLLPTFLAGSLWTSRRIAS